MWKKEDTPNPTTAPRADAAPAAERTTSSRPSSERASIGRSITIRGEVTGDEDLVIQGQVEGSVNLRQHSVTVGPEGVVKADIVGRVVTLEGSVEGNVSAAEQVILRSSAVVHGDITAPRVVLEDGARFRGGVDMGETAQGGRGAGAARMSADNPEALRAGGAQKSGAPLEAKPAGGREAGGQSGHSGQGASARTVQVSQ
jgi:cytoskeletal protein CcmA (bactofilin family)